MEKRYLAIDIGASSGRAILSFEKEGLLCPEEVYRFPNGPINRDGHLIWDLDKLFEEVKNGIKAAFAVCPNIRSLSIDTWGCDYVLLKGEDPVYPGYCYRDPRTESIIDEVHSRISFDELYSLTGIQFQPFNTIYQLYEDMSTGRLEGVSDFLMLPEYLSFRLTGVKKKEYTNATTTQLINVKTNTWDWELLEKLGLPQHIFTDPELPGTSVGALSPAIAEQVGFSSEVMLCASHDTGSAVMAVPSQSDNEIYLSSGTWSLMGIERLQADSSALSRSHNFTNEGGYNHRFRYLKNLMGMWMLQNLRKEFSKQYTFKEQYALAAAASDFASTVDVNDALFLAPKSMSEALRTYCRNSGQAEPQTEGELLYCVYHSLALGYDHVIKELEELTGSTFDCVNVIGGGCQDLFLNRLTALITGKKIKAGPIEGTAVGNLMCQMIQSGEYASLKEGRAAVAKSFAVKEAATDLAQVLA